MVRLLFTAVLVSFPLHALAGADVGMRLDHSSLVAPLVTETTGTVSSHSTITMLQLRGGYRFDELGVFIEVPMALLSEGDEAPGPGETGDHFATGNLTVELGRVEPLGKGGEMDLRLRLYLPTMRDDVEPGQQRLLESAARVRPEETPMWFSETFTVAPRATFGTRLLGWFEPRITASLYQTLASSEPRTMAGIEPELRLIVSETGVLSAGYGIHDRLDGEETARRWYRLFGGFDNGKVSAGLEVRLRQAPDDYVDQMGTQFAMLLGGRF